jgi:Holliday junction resolvase RusA-like endonuclease
MIKITLPGEPISKMRPRVTRKGAYDPQSKQIHAAKFQVLSQLHDYDYLPFPSYIPVAIKMNFYFSVPKDKKKQKLFQTGHLDHIVKPDCDNIIKAYLDILNKIIYEDDKQVVTIYAEKSYALEPRTEILIAPKRGMEK